MIKKKLRFGFALLLSMMTIAAPLLFIAQGQIQSSPQQNLVVLSERAQQEVEALIDWIYSNEELIQKIEDNELLTDLEEKVVLFNQGTSYATSSKTAYELEDYETAVEDALEALRIFREVIKSIHNILSEVGVNTEDIIDMQTLLEEILRAQEKIDRLRELVSEEDTETIALIDNAEIYLDNAKEDLFNEKINEAKINLREANQIISQIVAIIKDQAENFNDWRIFSYCERIRERTRERFRYGRQQGINIDELLESLGYQSENQFMETLEGLIQEANNNSEQLNKAIEDLETIREMIQQMEETMTQSINQHQNRYGSGGNGAGYSSGQNSGGS